MTLDIQTCKGLLRDINPVLTYGKVSKVIGLVVEGQGIKAPLGSICRLLPDEHNTISSINAEVVGFRNGSVLFIPYEDMRGIKPGTLIKNTATPPLIPVGKTYLGQAINAFGQPLGKNVFSPARKFYPLYAEPLNPLDRPRISQPLDVGIKAINSLLTLGKGQRIGIMAGSGVGKSTLMGMMARYTKADINIIALVGERGREVLEFMEKDLGPEGMARSILVVATSDQGPLIRMRAAYAATAIAEYFRDQGRDVLLMMDSVTRFAMAAREVGLAAGEPPTTRGYTPTVFTQLPKLLERTGNSPKGSITGIYTVLVEGDDFNEPVADAVRSILDGHIVLTRELADEGHYPSIDILKSVSRLRVDIIPQEIIDTGQKIIHLMAAYTRASDMINIGAYVKGSNPEIDQAIRLVQPIKDLLRQNIKESFSLEKSFSILKSIIEKEKQAR